jgi:hypothetical protein
MISGPGIRKQNSNKGVMKMQSVLIAIIILLIPIPSLSQKLSPDRTDVHQKQRIPDNSDATNQKKTTQPPIVVNVVPAPQAQAEIDDERRHRKEKTDLDRNLVNYTAQLAKFTAGLFYATVAVAVATIFLFIATTALAIFGFFQSRDTKASNRPWMGFGLSNIGKLVEGTNNITVTIISAGKSPGKITLMQAAAGLFVGEFPDNTAYPKFDVPNGQSVLVPNQVSNMRWIHTLSSQNVTQVQNGEICFYVFAQVIYDDLITGTSHKTTMCQRYDPATERYVLTAKHNTAT